jgi:hypothetical protein
MRLNNADPLLATRSYINEIDDDSANQAAFLAALPDDTLQIHGVADQVFHYEVTDSVDQTGYFEVTLERPVIYGPGPTNGAIVTLYSTVVGGLLAGAG